MDINNTEIMPRESENIYSDQDKYNLPHPLSRLHGASTSSSNQDESQIRTTYSKGKPVTTKSQKRRDKQASLDDLQIIRTPGWIQLQGNYTSFQKIDMLIKDELLTRNKYFPQKDFLDYFNHIFEMGKKDDMAVIKLAWSYVVVYADSKDLRKPLKRCKQLLHKISSYELKEPLIAFSNVYLIMLSFYICKSKPGKAHAAAQTALMCLQNYAPCEWTAEVWVRMAGVYDLLAHIRQGYKRRYQDLAVKCLITATEHLSAFNSDSNIKLCLLNTLHIAAIKLDIPLLATPDADPDIEYYRLKLCTVSQCQVTEAQNLLASVRAQASALTGETARANTGYIHKYILRVDIIIHIHLALAENNPHLAQEYVQRGLHLTKQLMKLAGILARVFERVLNDLNEEVKIRLHTLDICHPHANPVNDSSPDILSSVSTE